MLDELWLTLAVDIKDEDDDKPTKSHKILCTFLICSVGEGSSSSQAWLLLPCDKKRYANTFLCDNLTGHTYEVIRQLLFLFTYLEKSSSCLWLKRSHEGTTKKRKMNEKCEIK